jgi:SAM-dependent methyltransferase
MMNRSSRVRWTRLLPAIVVLGVLAFLVGLSFVGKHGTHPLTGRRIAGIATDPRWMDRSSRVEEEQPERALDMIGEVPGMIGADVGAGSGYMTTRLARRVGPHGKVYANDVQPALLEILRDKARREGLTNIEIVLGTEDDARLPERAIDLALLVDVYHEFSQPQKMLRSIRRSLKPEGELVLVEYRIPIADEHRLSVAHARTEVQADGFIFDRLISGLPRQHIIVFRR